ncbi:uncharacterized protein LOC129599091 [Paramacrobiotus metropolitanus]|uniref:uncharacterized protein LOC129599091 n=1 Tax=Paramacrobiotus metropolitanus TaxID=2943436 RepID=UPI0024457D36|nr:uncharacterized protein LOC129599091 [Paramacrobiotus metropolitanus]
MSSWNTVYVRIDGLLQYGKVINKLDNGLIIDFQCAPQRAQFVEYGRVFRPWESFTPQDTRPDSNIQALLLVSPDRPWTWYPGKKVSLSSDGYFASVCLVEVQQPHGVVKELLPWEQVHRPPSDTQLINRGVWEEDFLIRGCPLPAGWLGASPEHREAFLSSLPRASNVLVVSVLSNALVYVQPRCGGLLPSSLEQLFDSLRNQIVPPPIAAERREETRQTIVCADALVQSLPSELLVEILHSLDSISRVRCRRTCPRCDALLTTDGCKPPVFWALTCLLHCVNSLTTTVVLLHMDMSKCRDAVTILRYILGHSRRIGTLVCWA